MFRLKTIAVVLLLGLFWSASSTAADDFAPAKLTMFYSPSCYHCIQARQEVMPKIEAEFKDKVVFEYLDISQEANYRLLLGLLQADTAGTKFQIPLFYMGTKFLAAKGELYDNLRVFIAANLKSSSVTGFNTVDLVAHFKSFVPAAVVFAGLGDGINPCAFTVIIFFISFLALQGYRKQQVAFIGLAFIFAVFLTYLGIGLGIFNFLYRFRGFWAVTYLLNVLIGILSIILGIFALYDFIEFRKTGSTEGLILQLPKPIKERIHQVVGFFYRRSRQEQQFDQKPALSRLFLSALGTGFLVSLLEAVCTGQVYLPTISFVLKSTSLKLEALGYLLLYNIMFIVPLLVIFILALLGATNQQFSGFLRKRLGLIKILMAILFFGLGGYLLWRV
jgi:cytochrome c biogenesis protein CcdA